MCFALFRDGQVGGDDVSNNVIIMRAVTRWKIWMVDGIRRAPSSKNMATTAINDQEMGLTHRKEPNYSKLGVNSSEFLSESCQHLADPQTNEHQGMWQVG